jgi:coronin-1B/1C/6
VAGHKGAVLDIKWCPFNDNIIASCSEDCTIKIWNIPDDRVDFLLNWTKAKDGGLIGKSNLTDPVVDLHGHQKKVMYVHWHPTAANILLSASADNHIVIWNCGMSQALVDIDCHPNLIQCISWNYDGSRFVTSCKDGQIRIINPRSGEVLKQFKGHGGGTKSTQVTFLKNGMVFSTGFSKMSEREYALWDSQKGIFKVMETIDQSNGVLFHHYDVDTGMIYLIGKGDSVVRYYEINDDLPFVHYIAMYQSATPQRGAGFMPKRGCDPSICEITRLFKLHTKGLVEVIPMICPRKSEIFQEDLYPDTIGDSPALQADEWFEGKDADPILISMRDFMAPSSAPKIQVAGPKPNLLASLACGTKTPETKPVSTVQNDDNAESNVAAKNAANTTSSTPSAPPRQNNVAATTNGVGPASTPAKQQSLGFDTSIKPQPNTGPSKEEFEELVSEIKKLKVVVLRQEKKMEALETRIKEYDVLLKEASTFKLANGSRGEGDASEQDV